MKKIILPIMFIILLFITGCSINNNKSKETKIKPLTEEESILLLEQTLENKYNLDIELKDFGALEGGYLWNRGPIIYISTVYLKDNLNKEFTATIDSESKIVSDSYSEIIFGEIINSDINENILTNMSWIIDSNIRLYFPLSEDIWYSDSQLESFLVNSDFNANITVYTDLYDINELSNSVYDLCSKLNEHKYRYTISLKQKSDSIDYNISVYLNNEETDEITKEYIKEKITYLLERKKGN